MARGHQASADYVVGLLEPAGYEVTIQPFDFAFVDELSPSELDRVSLDPKAFENGTDFATMLYSGAGDVPAQLEAVDVVMPPTGGSTSGCEASDFAGLTPGNVALIQRGTCTFQTKAQNAEAAGASAVIIYNEGNTPDRADLFFGTPIEPGIDIPVLSASFAVGEELFNNTQAGETTVHVLTDTISEIRETYSVLAETAEGTPQSVMMSGAHLDSVLDSPSMNYNASGTAAVLETALQMAELGIEPRNKLRFAFWGAEELGLLGSFHYVSTLSDAERSRIKMHLNFDVEGSINGFPFVYTPEEGDGTPPASAEATEVFNDYFDSVGLPHDPTPLLGASDHMSFLEFGVASGGLFSGATGIKDRGAGGGLRLHRRRAVRQPHQLAGRRHRTDQPGRTRRHERRGGARDLLVRVSHAGAGSGQGQARCGRGRLRRGWAPLVETCTRGPARATSGPASSEMARSRCESAIERRNGSEGRRPPSTPSRRRST